MGRIQIDTDMLICALEDHNFEVHYYLDIKTGEIVTLTDLDIQGMKRKRIIPGSGMYFRRLEEHL